MDFLNDFIAGNLLDDAIPENLDLMMNFRAQAVRFGTKILTEDVESVDEAIDAVNDAIHSGAELVSYGSSALCEL